MCRNKERLHKKFRDSKKLEDGLKFSNERKKFKNLMKQKMRDNLCNPDSDNTNILNKKFWSYVKATSNSHRIPEVIKHKSRASSSDKVKADLFNEFFFDQFSEHSNYNIDIDFSDDGGFDIDFSPLKVTEILSTLNPNKASGPNGIHGKLLKNCAISLSRPLSIIFNIIYNTGSIPSQWKQANIVPVFKKGDKKLVSNYRPISLTCLVSKVMERIIQQDMLIRTEHLLKSSQHGFTLKKSCVTNLVEMTNSLTLSLNENTDIDVIYFDFSKAFDMVNHDLILDKLKHQYKIEGRLLRFMVDYLQGRTQNVVIGNSVSDGRDVLSGVPQGSILGPLLFILFINDMQEGISDNTSLSLYADDTKISRPITSEGECHVLQRDTN